MQKSIDSWQSWVIAIGLCLMIPVTLHLGIDVLAPAINWKSYSQDRLKYVPVDAQFGDQQEYKKYEQAWRDSAQYQMYEQQKHTHNKIAVIISVIVAILLLLLSLRINSLVIRSGCIVATLLLTYWHSYQELVFGYPVAWMQIAGSLICLLIVVTAAKSESE